MTQERTAAQHTGITPKQHQLLDELARDLKYGTLTLVFQDGLLVQVDRNEKFRLPKEAADPTAQ